MSSQPRIRANTGALGRARSVAEVIMDYADYGGVGNMDLELRLDGIVDVDSLAAASAEVMERWHDQAALASDDLLGRAIDTELVSKLGPFRLQRFMTDLDPVRGAHLGEVITRTDGRIGYLKTCRLSKRQTRRANLLRLLATHDWNVAAAAKADNNTKAQLIQRINNQGFGYLLNPEVLFQATKHLRRR